MASVSRRNWLIPGVVILSILVGGVYARGRRSQAGNTQRPAAEFPAPTAEERRAQAQAESRGGLQAAAAVTGVFVTSRMPALARGTEPARLEELLGLSDVIVVGWVASHRMDLSQDGRGIVSDYRIKVETLLKGRTTGKEIHVVMPGGRVSFPDGSIAQVSTPGFVRPLNDRRYLLFLTSPSDPKSEFAAATSVDAFVLSAGPLSVFDVMGNQRAKPSGLYSTFLAKAIWSENISTEGFIERVRQLVKQ